MVHSGMVRVWTFGKEIAVSKYARVHTVLGGLNFGIMGLLFYYYEFSKDFSWLSGHFIHITFGFFADRHISFVETGSTVTFEASKYLFVDFVTLCAIAIVMYICELLSLPFWMSRVVYASLAGLIVHYLLSKYWTFK